MDPLGVHGPQVKNPCSKEKAELLASKLKEQNMVEKVVKVSYYRKCNRDFSLAFKVERPFCYWHDIEKLFQTLSIVYIMDKWRLFIDSSERSLKVVFLQVEKTLHPYCTLCPDKIILQEY